jgi:hypothetical protein
MVRYYWKKYLKRKAKKAAKALAAKKKKIGRSQTVKRPPL